MHPILKFNNEIRNAIRRWLVCINHKLNQNLCLQVAVAPAIYHETGHNSTL